MLVDFITLNMAKGRAQTAKAVKNHQFFLQKVAKNKTENPFSLQDDEAIDNIQYSSFY